MKTRGKGVLTQLSHSALLLIAVGMGNAYAATDTAIITITGKVVANTCTMSSGSATQTVTLNDIADRDIRGKGVTGGDKNISIVLKDCGTAASAVKVSAWGSADSEDNQAFGNAIAKSDGGADGVALYFYQTNGTTKYNPDGSVTETSNLTPAADNTLNYKASYVGTKDTVAAGSFMTVVNMNFEYL